MPSDVERWSRDAQLSGGAPLINLDSYEVTIIPSERGAQYPISIPLKTSKDASYSTWFTDLSGGRTEYIITVACIIGKSRMKGAMLATTLVPHGPRKPRNGNPNDLT